MQQLLIFLLMKAKPRSCVVCVAIILRRHFTNSMSESPRALSLSSQKASQLNGFKSPHRICTITSCTLHGWHRNYHSLHASSLKFVICISFLFRPVFKPFSTRALSRTGVIMHTQQLPHCKNKNTQHEQTFNYIFLKQMSKNAPHYKKCFNNNNTKSSLPLQSPKRGIHPFSKMKFRRCMNVYEKSWLEYHYK